MINRLSRLYSLVRPFAWLLFWIAIAGSCIAELIILVWVLLYP